MDISQNCFIAIESAVRAGSVALFRDGMLVGSHVGDDDRSRSEDLLPNIAEMLDEAKVRASQLQRILVSRGPGSFTGIRIGIATAMGLRDSLGIPATGVSLFDAIYKFLGKPVDASIVVPIGRNDLAWQRFESGSTGDDRGNFGPKAGIVDDFLDSVRDSDEAKIYCHSSIREALTDTLDRSFTVIGVGPNLAEIIGNSVLPGEGYSLSLDPIYVSNSTLRT